MTSGNSIWGVPCPSHLKCNENVFIIGAQVDRGAFARFGLGAFHRLTILSYLRNIVSFYFRRHLLRLDKEAVFRSDSSTSLVFIECSQVWPALYLANKMCEQRRGIIPSPGGWRSKSSLPD